MLMKILGNGQVCNQYMIQKTNLIWELFSLTALIVGIVLILELLLQMILLNLLMQEKPYSINLPYGLESLLNRSIPSWRKLSYNEKSNINQNP